MKRIASFLTIFFLALAVHAQTTTPLNPKAYVMANDTATLVNAKTVTARSVNYTNVQAAKTTTITYSLTRNSGTAAGVVRLEGTVDGVTWHKLDSLVLVNTLVNKKYWILTDNAFNAYRTQTIGSGTQNGTPKTNILMRMIPKD